MNTQIKAEELRIGNLVQEESTGLLFKANIYIISWFSQSHQKDRYQAVPITEELLLKAGFERLANNTPFYHRTTTSSTGRKLVFNLGQCLNGSYSPLSYIDVHEEIIYFHQLQNLYFALTGKELTL